MGISRSTVLHVSSRNVDMYACMLASRVSPSREEGVLLACAHELVCLPASTNGLGLI